MKLSKRVAIISGASHGLGYEIAKRFIQEGADVMLCARQPDDLLSAYERLFTLAKGKVRVLAAPVDVSIPEQVDDLIDMTLSEFGKVDILVANAAIYGTKGPIDEIDWDEWSYAIDVNLKGTVLQCRAVVPHFKRQQHGKIIVVSGGGATKPMPNLSAYAASKAAVVRFAETLAVELEPYRIDVNALAPGAMNTRFLDEILEAGPQKVGKDFYAQCLKQKASGGAPIELAAALCAFLASATSDGISGKLISALWDPWKKLPDYLEELKNSDIYTLRRIVPGDRGKEWDADL